MWYYIFLDTTFTIISTPPYSIFENSLLKTGFQHVKLIVRNLQFVACIRSLHSISVINSVSLALQITRQAALKKSFPLLFHEDWKWSPLNGSFSNFFFTIISCSIFVLFLHIFRIANCVFIALFVWNGTRKFKYWAMIRRQVGPTCNGGIRRGFILCRNIRRLEI